MKEFTHPLKSGAKLPNYPADTTAHKIVSYGEVFDSHDGHPLTQGLHNQEIQLLMGGNPIALNHLYRYAIRNGHILHTRSRVVVQVETVDVE